MADRFPSLSSFLKSTDNFSKKQVQQSLDDTESQIQRILNDTSVRLSVYNNSSNGEATEAAKVNNEQLFNAIQEGVTEVSKKNADRVKTLLDSIFEDKNFTEEREHYWVDKLCSLFNLDLSLPYETKCEIINKKLSDSSEYLNYAMYMIDTGS